MKNSRILVNPNQISVNTITTQAHEAAATVNRVLLPALTELGITITEAVIKECITNGSATMVEFFDGVRKDVENVKTASIKKQMMAEANKAWDAVHDAFMLSRNEAGRFARYLSFVDGRCVMTPDAEEELADQYRIYLTEPGEITAYKLHCQIVDQLNQLFKDQTPYRWWNLFTEDTTGKLTRNDSVDYQRLIRS